MQAQVQEEMHALVQRTAADIQAKVEAAVLAWAEQIRAKALAEGQA